MIKAILLSEPGAVMHLGEIEPPTPGPGEIQVGVRAVGLNPADYKLAKNGWPTWNWPHVTGIDGAGVVEAVGEEVESWSPGDRVAFHANMGGPGVFAEQVCVPAHVAFRIPSQMSFGKAAALPCAGLTAFQVVQRKFPRPRGDELVLVHAGAGGVGSFAIQLCKRLGLEVVTTCSPESDDFVRGLGAEEVIHYAEEDVTGRLLAMTDGRGADWIVSLVDRAGATVDLVERLAYGGHLACVVGLADLTQLKPYTKAASVHEIALNACHISGDRLGQEDLSLMGEELIGLVDDGKIQVPIADVLDFAAIPEGLARLAGRHVRGKLVADLG